MPSAHVDLVEVGAVTLTGPDHDTGSAFADTAIALPDAEVDALVLRVGARTSTVFSEARLTRLDAAAAGDRPADANSVRFNELGVSLEYSTQLGVTAPGAAAPRGTLLVANVARPLEVQLWHLEPAEIGPEALRASLAARVAPAPTAATRGRYVRQSDTAETLVYAADDPPERPGDRYATVEQYLDRNQNAGGSTDGVADTLAAAARLIDRRLGWCPGAFAPLAERTMTFWPPIRPSRVLRFRDSEGRAWPWRTITVIGVDYGGTGAPDHVWTLDDEDWLVPQPHGGRPWRSLRIHESHRRATESVWPSDPGTVTVTGEPGHDATPEPITEITVHVAREMRDGHLGGAAAVFTALDSGVSVEAPAARLWAEIKREWSAGRPGRLGVVTSAAARRRW